MASSAGYALQFSKLTGFAVFASALAVACASAIVGAALGFLFAIPRRRNEPVDAAPLTAVLGQSTLRTSHDAGVRANTNLEDVSDWLTKLLVGVGLTQLGAVGDGLGRLSRTLVPSFGETSTSAAFGLAVVFLYTLTGFLASYLWTRFYLGAAFQKAETEVLAELPEVLAELHQKQLDLTERVDAVKDEQQEVKKVLVLNEVPGALGLAQEDLHPLEPRLSATTSADESTAATLEKYALEYERIRSEVALGSQRTLELSRVVTDERSLAAQEENILSAESIRSLFNKSDGGRVAGLAWIGAKAMTDLLDLVIEAIQHSNSGFEQYEALRAAEDLMAHLSPEQRLRLKAATEEQMGGGEGKRITPETDRWPLAVRVLQRIASPMAG